jgi:hypothetical protein
MKVYISLIICMLLAGCGSDIDKVKKGFLGFNKTLTVGQALDNWKSCESKDWKSFTSDNGVRVVDFTCHHKTEDYFSDLKSYMSKSDRKHPTYIDIVDHTQTFQFTLNKDDTFQINAVSVQYTWSDGKNFKGRHEGLEQLSLNKAYKNKMHFEPEDLTTSLMYELEMIYEKAKALPN